MENIVSDPRTQRKRLGSFYTPPHLAKLITNDSLNIWLQNQSSTDRDSQLESVQNLKILDPSVGAGVFLIAAAEWLDKTRQTLGEKLGEKKRRESIITNSLFGVDIEDSAVANCRSKILRWASYKDDEHKSVISAVNDNIRLGNSLTLHDWTTDFLGVTTRKNPGFDIILGNPPYGNLLTEHERDLIQNNYPFNVGGSRTGTWNSAAHFIVRASMMLRYSGELAFLIPNSILRVKQFTKIRQFLIEHLKLWKIIDEGSPFDDVTLEMVTIFCTKQKHMYDYDVKVESRRPSYEQKNSVPLNLLRSSKIFSIYHDEIFDMILKRGQRNLLVASRGRDIPRDYVKQSKTKEFNIPYITSGRSVRRYFIDSNYQTYTNDWYLRNQGMNISFSNELLVATKNYRFPRCVIKPVGMIHGGGIVQIIPASKDMNLRTIGLILNSKLIQYICSRYLANYSQLTTCLNTGILEELPIVLPANPETYAALFNALTKLYSEEQSPKHDSCVKVLETVSEALIYDLYFGNSHLLEKEVTKLIKANRTQIRNPFYLCDCLSSKLIESTLVQVMTMAVVDKIENRLNEVLVKSPRY